MTNAFWIWCDNSPKLEKEACFFRKVLTLDSVPGQCQVKISADSIYRFYVNGRLVARGPQKSDRYRRYYDTVDIASALVKGVNILAAFVCHFIDDEENSRSFETGPTSVLCSLRGGFVVMSDFGGISTDRSWLVHKTGSIRFISPHLSRYATDMLAVNLRDYPYAFTARDFDDSAFQKAVIVDDTGFERFAGVTCWPLTPANIPQLRETPLKPLRMMRSNIPNAEALLERGSLKIDPGSNTFFEIDMGSLTTANLEVMFEYGSDKKVSVGITYAESYYKLDEKGQLYKGVRDDASNAVFTGETDTAELLVEYGASRPLKFETVFFRTFRFLRFDIGMSNVPIVIRDLKITEIAYPLKVEGELRAPEKERKMWDISVNTLRLCMHSTYEDCPYYEQMQYTMDTALQMKYTYQLTTDDRLARNAIDAFSASRIPDGLVKCNYPSKFTQVIPGFAMYFIEMLYDHYTCFADEKFIKKYLCIADSILQYFIQKTDPATGLFPRSDYWEFVDWVGQWHHNFGVPISKSEEINTVYHQMLVYFLKKAADLNAALGRTGIAGEYRETAQKVAEGVRKYCYNGSLGLFTDTVGREDTSVHAQFWAVLSGIAEGDPAKELMHQVLNNDRLFQCSYSMSFYLFRALEMTGHYGYSGKYLKIWEGMMENHMSTWCEDPVTQRSDCHGWSSVPIYEFSNMLLGVKPALPAYAKIRIAPFTENHQTADGTVSTVKGTVDVKWVKTAGKTVLDAKTPRGVPVEVVLNNRVFEFAGGGEIHVEAGT